MAFSFLFQKKKTEQPCKGTDKEQFVKEKKETKLLNILDNLPNIKLEDYISVTGDSKAEEFLKQRFLEMYDRKKFDDLSVYQKVNIFNKIDNPGIYKITLNYALELGEIGRELENKSGVEELLSKFGDLSYLSKSIDSFVLAMCSLDYLKTARETINKIEKRGYSLTDSQIRKKNSFKSNLPKRLGLKNEKDASKTLTTILEANVLASPWIALGKSFGIKTDLKPTQQN